MLRVLCHEPHKLFDYKLIVRHLNVVPLAEHAHDGVLHAWRSMHLQSSVCRRCCSPRRHGSSCTKRPQQRNCGWRTAAGGDCRRQLSVLVHALGRPDRAPCFFP
jgi:hypothetical protein